MEAAMNQKNATDKTPAKGDAERMPLIHEAADWDEEDLGLAWDEDEAQRITAELTAGRRSAN
jgi:hypothetical protein